MADFVKKSNDAFGKQLDEHADALGTHGAALGFSGPEITVAVNDAKYFRYELTQQAKALSFSQGYTRHLGYLRTSKDVATEPVFTIPATIPTSVLVGIETRFRERAKKAKASTAYNNDIGEQLRIVAPDATAELGIPEFEVVFAANHPVLKWPKKISDGIEVWKDKGQGWYHAGNDTKSPWPDKEDLPPAGQSAIWKYRIIFIVDDEPVGEYSAVITVLVSQDASGSRAIAN
jgi:hypothetical protein